MRHPPCFLWEGRAEVMRDKQAISVDKASYWVSGKKTSSGHPAIETQTKAAGEYAP